MNEVLHRSTQDLIAKIERTDQRFRVFQSASLAIIGVGVIILLALNYNAQTQTKAVIVKQNQLITEVKNLEGQNKQLSVQNKQGIDSIHQQINCVLQFFAQPAPVRSNSTIPSAIPCLITSGSGGATGSTKSAVSNNAKTTPAQTGTSNNNAGSVSQTPTPPSPSPQPKQGFLQRTIIQPIINLTKGLF